MYAFMVECWHEVTYLTYELNSNCLPHQNAWQKYHILTDICPLFSLQMRSVSMKMFCVIHDWGRYADDRANSKQTLMPVGAFYGVLPLRLVSRLRPVISVHNISSL